ncbi:MAG: tryptophan synthase subunit alpha [Planctomycetes bacterium]|nr:tryptophan synthase subunit alpha [Planctomycetota bacterium]
MNPIDRVFRQLREQRRKAFMPFVTAGDPDLETTIRLVRDIANRGASLIEIGFPFTDPIADGSVIQASYTRALAGGVRMDDVFAAFRKLSAPGELGDVSLISMISFSLVHHRGPERFILEAKEAGFSGAIVPDLPIEEAADLVKQASSHDFKLIQLVTPTTPRDRARQIAHLSTGFLYCVSVVGITGTRTELPPELLDQLRWLRTQTDLPLCVGFGISKPEHMRMLRDHVDGVIVGSALVRHLETIANLGSDAAVAAIGMQVKELAHALNSA